MSRALRATCGDSKSVPDLRFDKTVSASSPGGRCRVFGVSIRNQPRYANVVPDFRDDAKRLRLMVCLNFEASEDVK